METDGHLFSYDVPKIQSASNPIAHSATRQLKAPMAPKSTWLWETVTILYQPLTFTCLNISLYHLD